MRKLLLFLLLFISLCAKAQYENYWHPNPYQFPNNMTIIGVISFGGEEQRSESLEIGAFCEDECRGSSIAIYEEAYDRYYLFMMLYGEHEDEMSFRCYDHRLGLELDLIPETTIEFHANDMIGTVTEPFIFSFQTYQYSISIDLLPEIGGSTDGEGTYNKYDTCYINITPNTGYQFDALLENGDTITKQNQYSFIVLSDRHFEACLSEIPIYYQITAETSPSPGGVITGTGQYLEDETCTLQIIPNSGYIYEGLYENEELVTTETTYSFTANSDRHFIAKFSLQINYYQVTADITPDNAGTITGLGAYQEGDVCNITVTINEGYHFIALKENGEIVSEESDYSFIVNSDRHFVAEFKLQEFNVSLSANPEEGGYVSGGGTYQYGTTVYAIANPNKDYTFLNWTNEEGEIVSTSPQYIFEVKNDINLIANFIYVDNILESNYTNFSIYPNPASDFIIVENDNSYQYDMTIYDMTGKVVLKKQIDSIKNKINIGELPDGTYIISFNNKTYYKLIINSL